jgi:hypothetical protein
MDSIIGRSPRMLEHLINTSIPKMEALLNILNTAKADLRLLNLGIQMLDGV